MYGYIYETTNLINGKKYIGKHKSSKFDKNYYGSGIAINRALNKYGKENFEVRLIEEIETNQDYLDLREMYYIEKYNAVKDNNYYNYSYGGENEGWSGVNRARKENPERWKEIMNRPEHKRKISESQKEIMKDPEARKKISKANTGRKRTDAQKELISRRTKEAMKNPDVRRKLSEVHIGKCPTEYTRKRVSEYWKERCKNPEEKKRRSILFSGENNPMYGKHHTEEAKRKISDKTRERFSESIIWVNNGECCRRIKKEDLDRFLKDGYILGRKIV